VYGEEVLYNSFRSARNLEKIPRLQIFYTISISHPPICCCVFKVTYKGDINATSTQPIWHWLAIKLPGTQLAPPPQRCVSLPGPKSPNLLPNKKGRKNAMDLKV